MTNIELIDMWLSMAPDQMVAGRYYRSDNLECSTGAYLYSTGKDFLNEPTTAITKSAMNGRFLIAVNTVSFSPSMVYDILELADRKGVYWFIPQAQRIVPIPANRRKIAHLWMLRLDYYNKRAYSNYRHLSFKLLCDLRNINNLRDFANLPFDTIYELDTEEIVREKLNLAESMYQLGAI